MLHAITQQFLTYTIYLYTYAEIHLCRPGQMQICGKVQAMSGTYGASGDTSDTNTGHGLMKNE